MLSSPPVLPTIGADVSPSLNTRTPSAVVHLGELRRMRAAQERIACLTAYDASFAAVLDRAGVDLVLVGDSLGMVVQGRASTTPVTVADIVYHCRCVSPQLRRAFLVADLPFLSYATRERALQLVLDTAVRNGLTGVHDMGTSREDLALMRRFADQGRLPLRLDTYADGDGNALADLCAHGR